MFTRIKNAVRMVVKTVYKIFRRTVIVPVDIIKMSKAIWELMPFLTGDKEMPEGGFESNAKLFGKNTK